MMELHYNYYSNEIPGVMATGCQDEHSAIRTKPIWVRNGHQRLDCTMPFNSHNLWTRSSSAGRNKEIVDFQRTNDCSDYFIQNVSQMQPYSLQRRETYTEQCSRPTTLLDSTNERQLEVPGQPLGLIKKGYYKEFLAESLLKQSVQESAYHQNDQSNNNPETYKEDEYPTYKKMKIMNSNDLNDDQNTGSAFRIFSRKKDYSHLEVKKERIKRLPPPPPLVKLSIPALYHVPQETQKVQRSSKSHCPSLSVSPDRLTKNNSITQHIQNSTRPSVHTPMQINTRRSEYSRGRRETLSLPLGYKQDIVQMNAQRPSNTRGPREFVDTPGQLDYTHGTVQMNTRSNTRESRVIVNAPWQQDYHQRTMIPGNTQDEPRSMDIDMTMNTMSRIENSPRPQNNRIISRPKMGREGTLCSPTLGNTPNSSQVTRRMERNHEPRLHKNIPIQKISVVPSGNPDRRMSSLKNTSPRHDVIVIRDSPPLTGFQQEATRFCPNPRIASRTFSFESEKTLQHHNCANTYCTRCIKHQQINQRCKTKIQRSESYQGQSTSYQTRHSYNKTLPTTSSDEKTLQHHNCANSFCTQCIKGQQFNQRCKTRPIQRSESYHGQCKNFQSSHSQREPLPSPSRSSSLIMPSSRSLSPFLSTSVSDSKSMKRPRSFSYDHATNIYSSGHSKSKIGEKHGFSHHPSNTNIAPSKIREAENDPLSKLHFAQSGLSVQSPPTKSLDSETQHSSPYQPPQNNDDDNSIKSSEHKKKNLSFASTHTAVRRLSFPQEKKNETVKEPIRKAFHLDNKKQDNSIVSKLPTEIPEIEEDSEDLKPYGGYAYDHDSLPIIVAVHSIGVNNTKSIDKSNPHAPENLLLEKSSSVTSFCTNSANYSNSSSTCQEVSTKSHVTVTITSMAPCHSENNVTENKVMKTTDHEATSLDSKGNNSEKAAVCKVNEDEKPSCPAAQENSTPMEKLEKHSIDDVKNALASITCQVQPFRVVQDQQETVTTTKQTKHITVNEKQATEQAGIAIDITQAPEVTESNVNDEKMKKESTVRVLSEKVLDTRKRIEKENIEWKRKLLRRLELVLTKKLRKAELMTGEKAEIELPPIIQNKTQLNSNKKLNKETEQNESDKISRKKKKHHKMKKVLHLRKTTEETSSDYELTIEETQESHETVCLDC